MGNKASQIRKNFIKSPYKSNKSYKNYTHVLHISIYTCDLHRSTSSFENKPLIIIDWSLKSIKCSHHHFPNCDQNEKIKKIYSLVKKYYHKYCTHNLSILIKYFISHIFSYCFAYIATREICAYKNINLIMSRNFYFSSNVKH